jgi:cytochrome c oxidase subunit II
MSRSRWHGTAHVPRPFGLVPIGVALALLSLGCEGNQSMFNPQGPAAQKIADLGWILISVCGVVYVLVMAALGWALMRARRQTDNQPQTSQRLGTIVAGAVTLTTLILVALTAASAAFGRGLSAPQSGTTVTVDVVGHQWWWDFQYRHLTPSDLVTSPNELHIPVGIPVVLNVQSRDVIHSFWVPNLHGKRDLIPGEVTRTWIQADAPGVYRGQCAEFCGHQHAKMAFNVVAEPMARFEEWMDQQRKPAAEPATDASRQGQEVFMRSTCVTCHAIAGTEAGSRIGPDLTHVGSRLTIAAGTLPNTRHHLTQWVSNPSAIRPGVRMPPNALSTDELEAVISYLRSLR